VTGEVETLDPERFHELVHLREHGISYHLSQLQGQLTTALGEAPPEESAGAVAHALLFCLAEDGGGGRLPESEAISIRMDEYDPEEADEADQESEPPDGDASQGS
jgi:hypothetical protein